MSKPLPEGCPRNLQCEPLHRIESEEHPSFACCGQHRGGNSNHYRFCTKDHDVYSLYDGDELDLLDTVEVAIAALSNAKRQKEPSDEQA